MNLRSREAGVLLALFTQHTPLVAETLYAVSTSEAPPAGVMLAQALEDLSSKRRKTTLQTVNAAFIRTSKILAILDFLRTIPGTLAS